MARIARVVRILSTLALLSWRDIRSLGSISGQNFFVFVLFVALQPQSAEFFLLLLLMVLIFPLSTDPMETIPPERRLSWPLLPAEWLAIRVVSLLLSPIAWVGILIAVRAGWQTGAQVLGIGAVLYAAKRALGSLPSQWSFRAPTPPGIIGAVAHLQVRTMLHTLDPYLALTLMVSTEIYRIFSKAPLDPAVPRIMSLVVALALSTHAQVLFAIDGRAGIDRFRQMPIRGWQILLGKDLAFLSILTVLVCPLDPISGFFGGLAALAVGHHQSVFAKASQVRWRFTSGSLFPHGAIQTVALFAVGTAIRTEGLPLAALCLTSWIASLFLYGHLWDRR